MTLITLKIRLSTGDTSEVKDVDSEITIAELKKILHERNIAGVEPDRQRLIFKGRILKDEETVTSVGLQDGMTLHLVKSLKGSSSSPAAASPTAAAAPPPAPAPGMGASPFGGAWPFPSAGTGVAGAPGAFDPFGMPPGMPQPTPEMLRAMMDNPMVQRMLDNPETIRAMIQSNPMLRAMIEQNPQLEHVLSDPQIMRQAMQAATNPAMMQELLRSQDRALANIESLPGGHNALRRLYEQDLDPMMQAAEETSERLREQQRAASASSANASSPANQGTGPAAAPMPNPWSAPQTHAPGAGAAPNPWAAFGTAGAARPPSNPFAAGAGANPWAAMGAGAAGGANPMAAMMQDPEYMRRMMDPANIQAMMQLTQAIEQLRRGGILTDQMLPPGFAAMPNLGAMFGAGGMPGFPPNAAPAVPAAPQQPPEVRFASQLSQLEGMGFTDRERNIQALTATNGNVNAAIERLLQ